MATDSEVPVGGRISVLLGPELVKPPAGLGQVQLLSFPSLKGREISLALIPSSVIFKTIWWLPPIPFPLSLGVWSVQKRQPPTRLPLSGSLFLLSLPSLQDQSLFSINPHSSISVCRHQKVYIYIHAHTHTRTNLSSLIHTILFCLPYITSPQRRKRLHCLTHPNSPRLLPHSFDRRHPSVSDPLYCSVPDERTTQCPPGLLQHPQLGYLAIH